MELKFYIPELKALQLFIYYQLLEFQSLLSQQIYVIANTLLIHIWCSYLILAKDVLICLQQYAQIEFLPKSIITVPHSGSSDPQIKSLATTEHAQIEGFFLDFDNQGTPWQLISFREGNHNLFEDFWYTLEIEEYLPYVTLTEF